jgi:hypothetical protein
MQLFERRLLLGFASHLHAVERLPYVEVASKGEVMGKQLTALAQFGRQDGEDSRPLFAAHPRTRFRELRRRDGYRLASVGGLGRHGVIAATVPSAPCRLS